jgi:hypothetical protein
LQQQVALQNASLGTNANLTNAGAVNATNTLNAQMQQQTNLANQQATLANNAEVDQSSLGLDNSQLQASQNSTQAAEAAAQLGQAYSAQNANSQQNAAANRSGLVGGLVGGAASAIGSLASSSDEEEKTDIAPAGGSMISNYLGQQGLGGGTQPATMAPPTAAQPDRKPGGAGGLYTQQTGGNALGEAQLAASPLHLKGANNAGMNAWIDSSENPGPTAAGQAAQANLGKFFFAGTAPGRSNGAGAGSGAGTAASDENEKENIDDADTKALHDFLGKLNAHSYEYKDPNKPGRAPGKQISPMAQEFEKSDIGKELVVMMPDGSKGVKYADPHALGALFAAQADAHKRLTALEKGKSKGKKK